MGDICEENFAGALEALAISDPISSEEVEESDGAQVHRTRKDPRKIARGYQIELCQKALDENIIVYLETGCGKTHIAVLLIYEVSFQIKKPQKDVCVFLAPTVALVEQQAKVIQESLDLKVGTYCGSSNRLKSHRDWEKELESFEVLVMTPQILLHNLSHCFIKIEFIALLIFDECHYAQAESNHPYAEIMKVFYKPDVARLPRIFGMTASPIFGKGTSIGSLETLLHAKVYTVEDREELDQFVSSPKVNVYHYGTAPDSLPLPHTIYCRKLEIIKHQWMLNLSTKVDDPSAFKNAKKALQRLHGNLLFCLENLGFWGALQACLILLKGNVFERNAMLEADGRCSDDALCGSYLSEVASDFAAECSKDYAVEVEGIEADLSCVETLKVPFFSWKLLRLVGILSSFRSQPDMKCIIFVNRIITARSLAYVLRQLKFLSVWRCGYLVGVHSGLKNMSRKTTNAILEKFRSGELNLLVATKVGEEGLDIQTCCLVIRFDLPETVASFIQSRGRARMPQSEYAFLVNRSNQKELELIESFRKDETQMNNEISSRSSNSAFLDCEEKTYKVDSTGATISAGSSVSLLHRYCSKLPHDEFFNPKPHFFYFDDAEGTVCKIILPANAPIHHIVSSPQSSVEAAKKDACLKACKELHEVGALTHYLLPDNEADDGIEDSSDSDDDDEGNTRRELHEMLIPATLREPWTKESTRLCLNSYYIKFTPLPADRLYKAFGLFVKAPIPGEGERMTLDLFLARGRSILTEIVPYGASEFVDDEIMLAERFQEMWLKVILDRSELTSDFVSLGKDDVSSSISSTFYLLLPVTVDEDYGSMTIDWKVVRKCLSSPIFRTPEDSEDGLTSNMNCLHIASGPIAANDVLNSLVYVPCKDNFFFVSDLLPEKNAFSECKESMNYVNWYAKIFNIHLLYPHQPLLKAKQLFRLDNILRKRGNSDSREKEEHFVELPPEICQLKILGFSKDIGSSLSVLPSVMHRLESFLVAIELKQRLSASFPEGAEVSACRVLEALTTERCNERFSLERLEVLGDAFLKFAVGRHLFLLNEALDEGQLTRKRSNMVNNSNLFKLAVSKNLQVYIRDQSFEPSHFFPFGRKCSVICNDNTKASIHSSQESSTMTGANIEIRCSRCHHWLQKKTVADVVEALIGAFIVDSGFKAAAAFLNWFGIQVDFKDSQVAKICSQSVMFTPLSTQIDIHALQDLLGYRFQHRGLLLQAFLHPSYSNSSGGCYQRLEFLGDAVLDYLITSYLYSVYPNLKPGQLTDLRSMSVNNNSFAGIAVNRSFHNFILCDSTSLTHSMNKYADFIKNSASEKENLLFETVSCPKVLGDLVESCVGAVLLDSGFNLDLVWKIMLSFLDPVMKFSALKLNPVRELQELCQFYDWELNFPSTKKDGAFSVEAKVDGKEICETACATNFNKKAAKRIAAKKLYMSLKDKGYRTRMKSLEEVLKVSQKMEAKLIGYDEIPADVNATQTNQFEDLKSKEPPLNNLSREMDPCAVNSVRSSSSCIRRLMQPSSQCDSSSGVRSTGTSENLACNDNLQTTAGGLSKSSAKSHLYEICAANYWKPPLFECCQETGPAHLKKFVFKVTVVTEEAASKIIECSGDPRPKKKDAAESAATGAIWYLKKKGYLQE